jgi:hypothetical protein
MQFLKMSVAISYALFGAIQLFVGPASASFLQQIKVLSSTRATSSVAERW